MCNLLRCQCKIGCDLYYAMCVQKVDLMKFVSQAAVMDIHCFCPTRALLQL